MALTVSYAFDKVADELFLFRVSAEDTWLEDVDLSDQVRYCLDNFGPDAMPQHQVPQPITKGAVWTFSNDQYWFLNEADAILFKLRYG